MSAPNNEFREAEYLGLGFLAVTSSELLDKLLEEKSLDEDEKYMLQRAGKFLRDVSSGAQLVTSGGVSSNVSAAETVRKLAYSVEPLKLMQDKIQSAKVGEAFENMANAIDAGLANSLGESERNDLKVATTFFHQLHVFLIGQVESRQQRTGIDPQFSMPLLAHA